MKQDETDAYHGMLAAAFYARRCACGAPVVFVKPGSAEVRDVFLLCQDVPDRQWCLEHAMMAAA